MLMLMLMIQLAVMWMMVQRQMTTKLMALPRG